MMRALYEKMLEPKIQRHNDTSKLEFPTIKTQGDSGKLLTVSTAM
jgi:hypothetical protein